MTLVKFPNVRLDTEQLLSEEKLESELRKQIFIEQLLCVRHCYRQWDIT